MNKPLKQDKLEREIQAINKQIDEADQHFMAGIEALRKAGISDLSIVSTFCSTVEHGVEEI